jgi:hypothetical protein
LDSASCSVEVDVEVEVKDEVKDEGEVEVERAMRYRRRHVDVKKKPYMKINGRRTGSALVAAQDTAAPQR